MEEGFASKDFRWLGCWRLNCKSRCAESQFKLTKVCSKTDVEMNDLLLPGGVDLSPLSHSDQGTRLRRLKRLFTEGHLFDVKYSLAEVA
jgi:hypothetical protein